MARTLAQRLEGIRDRIAAAAARRGRDGASVKLMAVSKYRPLSDIQEAYDAGLRLFGENRVQEGCQKRQDFFSSHPDASMHLIGHLQSNKSKEALEGFDCVQSIDSLGLAQRLSRLAQGLGRVLPVYLELHTGEDSKAGFRDEASLMGCADSLLALPGIRVEGFMTMAPFTDDEASIRLSFSRLRRLRDSWQEVYGAKDLELSMGMSNDFELAIDEGSTLVRIGTSLFVGERDEG